MVADPLRNRAALRFGSRGSTLECLEPLEQSASLEEWCDADFVRKQCTERGCRLVAGAIPYRASPRSEVALWTSAAPRWNQAFSAPAAAPFAAPKIVALEERPARREFLQSIEQLLDQIKAGRVQKAVLSRAYELSFKEALCSQSIFGQLHAQQHQGHVFELPYRHQGRYGVLVGASPELLLSREGSLLRSRPLAGSLPRSSNPLENEKRAATLLASVKDRREHAFVVEHLRDALSDLCDDLVIPSAPSVVATPTMLHLETSIHGQIKPRARELHALALALRLHPTPALCGVPTPQAQELIATLEPQDRELFGGTCGWMDAQGNGEWVVSIRCAQIEGNWARLQAGVGIVEGSSPELELIETDAKLQTMLRALGLSQLSSPRRPKIQAELRA